MEFDLRGKVVKTVMNWMGATKGDSRHHAIIDTYNEIDPLPRSIYMAYGYEWAAAAVSAVFQEAGLIGLIPAECSISNMMELAKEQGLWKQSGTYVPSPGDIVLFNSYHDKNWSEPTHIGIVTGHDIPGQFRLATVNGNRLCLDVLLIDSCLPYGYIAPDFAMTPHQKNEDNPKKLTYWVSWIVNGPNGRACAVSSSEACLSLEEAQEVVAKVRKDKETVCAWIDCHSADGKKTIGTTIMECYVDPFGERKKEFEEATKA